MSIPMDIMQSFMAAEDSRLR